MFDMIPHLQDLLPQLNTPSAKPKVDDGLHIADIIDDMPPGPSFPTPEQLYPDGVHRRPDIPLPVPDMPIPDVPWLDPLPDPNPYWID
jgi:hypothetical protein